MERDAASRKTNRFFGSRDLQLYSLIAASVVFLAIFNYLPMFGLIFAFKDGDGSLNIMNGMLHSDWTFDNFTRLFADKGHKDLSTTEKIYTHISTAFEQAEAQKLNAGKYTNLYTKTQPRTGEIVAS